MNYKQIIDSVLNKCNIDSGDEQPEKVVKDAINEGYREIARESKLIANSTVTINNKVAVLPDDMLEILRLDPPISDNDQVVGNNILTDKTGSFNLVYSYMPDDLIKDKDEPEVPLKYHSLLITYGCYKYYQFKKKSDIARDFYNSFIEDLRNLSTNNLGSSGIKVVYSPW